MREPGDARAHAARPGDGLPGGEQGKELQRGEKRCVPAMVAQDGVPALGSYAPGSAEPVPIFPVEQVLASDASWRAGTAR